MNYERKPGGSIQINEVFIYLCVANPKAAINFYAEVFGAEELFRLTGPEGDIAHAEIKLGPAVILIAGEYPDHNIRSPEYYGGTGIRIHLHVDDVDRLAERAQKAGVKYLWTLPINRTGNVSAASATRLAMSGCSAMEWKMFLRKNCSDD